MSREKILDLIELAKVFLEDGAEHSAHRKLGDAINTLEQHYGITANTPSQPESESVPVMNYDPNMVSSGRKAKQVVRLTFGAWEYRVSIDKTIAGNTLGLAVIESTVDFIYNGLFSKKEGYATLYMLNQSGDELSISDDDGRGEEWLKDLLISAEIVSITADGHF